ncbi:rod shape-determining protein [Candidatus Kaiserbacteria bacterium RIFCSPHIGHO2_02_FULL_50_50]|uniref:Cell shape-determining protein MreB n=1 Tax=Candidatus Kaiserbacteria bacterium RIFCSPHIGHO2_02_FULL_50_50 TaxID=1798492 RepID=A0A1F6DFU6_9BACT|nr:MAG: rod shape-determining protein [Candidatus Kaiserbacteria bacterium RIFCSPHIGHO2_02_FULL_50_50]OGG88926.1 MAG: rod shape-determining protein [Candidatus Kaiserbacteria bacterium RIFCSPLOWO2_12_FULL_50_10]
MFKKIITSYKKFLASMSTDIAIDLGTANTLVYVRGRGIVLFEPTIVAINRKTGQLVAVGKDAKLMHGRTPQHIEVIRPLVEGVISDFEITEQMIAYFISKVRKETRMLIPPRVLCGVPSGVTNVEMRAVRDAIRNAGAREVFLIEEPVAAAIGAKLPVHEARGNMVVDIGGGTTDIAVISSNGIVHSCNIRVAGDHLNQSIINYVRDQFKVLVGEKTAEDVKLALANIHENPEQRETTVRGRDMVTGLPREVLLTSHDVRDAIESHVHTIAETTRGVLEKTPPEIISDIMQRGIFLSGGGALIAGIAPLLEAALGVPVIVVTDPLRAVIRGNGMVLEDLDFYAELLVEKEGELSNS